MSAVSICSVTNGVALVISNVIPVTDGVALVTGALSPSRAALPSSQAACTRHKWRVPLAGDVALVTGGVVPLADGVAPRFPGSSLYFTPTKAARVLRAEND